jgi:signal transduction histidine kinase
LSQQSEGARETAAQMLSTAALAAAKLVAFGLLYYAAGRIGRRVDQMGENARVFWPQAGVALAGMLILGVRYWPAVFCSSLVTSRLADLPHPLPVGFAVANALGPAVGVFMLRRFGRFEMSLSRVHDIFAFILYGAVVAAFVNASVATGVFLYRAPNYAGQATDLWFLRCVSNAISILLVTPAFLTWRRMPGSGWPLLRIGELALLVSVIVTVCATVFMEHSLAGELSYPLSYAPFPFMIWAALRFGPRGATTATLLISALAVYGASKGAGPVGADSPQTNRLLMLELYLAVVALTGLFLAAATAERRTAEKEALESREQLRALSNRLQAAREEERTLIAREIHDELGQQLTGLKMAAASLRRKLPPDRGDLEQRCDELAALADDGVKAVRKIATDLRPGILDDLGIVASMQWLTGEFERRSGVPAAFECNRDDFALDTQRSTALFRILQEALTNVARHANATAVNVKLHLGGECAALTVEDDGVGIDGGAQREASTLGIVGMRERAELLGGTLAVDRRPDGGGTRVLASIPTTGKPPPEGAC